MSMKETYKHLFVTQVVSLVQSGAYLSEVECESVIKKWMKGLKKEYQPRMVEVQMTAKRRLNNLVEI